MFKVGRSFTPYCAGENAKEERVYVVEPLFPGYLFVNIERCGQLMSNIRSTRGIRQLLRFGVES